MDIAQLGELLQLLPIWLIGLLAGALNYFTNEKQSLKQAIGIVLTSSFVCSCVFAILSATDLPYLARVGMSASVGYFGIERALDILKNLINIKK
ncbi:phage holin family protein [Helicobacter baculiformis]|uniref:Phage holin family protein n=1 Tax=Helicobacter baculiformis TaxID=427351 RepID=A0ABV7ZH42_9HELI|nr:phage holin family protein [Helicobacter baculiformis]